MCQSKENMDSEDSEGTDRMRTGDDVLQVNMSFERVQDIYLNRPSPPKNPKHFTAFAFNEHLFPMLLTPRFQCWK